MLQRRSIAMGFALGLLVGGVIVWAGLGRAVAQSETPTVDWSGSSRNPYVIQSGQSSEKFQVLYILDEDSGKLMAVKFTGTSTPGVKALAGRDIGKDFGIKGAGRFSMTPVQLSNTRGILAVADNFSDKIVIYEVDAINNKIKPLKAARLDELFQKEAMQNQ